MDQNKEEMKKLYQSALDVQNACNLSGIVHSFSRDIKKLRELNPGMGTDDINRHPFCVLYSSKIASLTCSECDDIDGSFRNNFSRAYNTAMDFVEGKV